jgi:plastocyanin
MARMLARLGVLALAVLLLGTACSKSNSSSTAEGGEGGGSITLPGGDTAENHGTADLSGKDEADVELDDFYFDPTVITGDPGSKVKLDLENEGSTEHNFSIDDQKLDQDVEPGEKQEVTITIPKSGEVEFYCKYHRSSGMAGELKAA